MLRLRDEVSLSHSVRTSFGRLARELVALKLSLSVHESNGGSQDRDRPTKTSSPDPDEIRTLFLKALRGTRATTLTRVDLVNSVKPSRETHTKRSSSFHVRRPPQGPAAWASAQNYSAAGESAFFTNSTAKR